MIYMQSALADVYLGVTVNGFSNGSIVVDYTVKFKDEEQSSNSTSNTTTSPFINSTTILTAFEEGLTMSVRMGVINFTIDETSVRIMGKRELPSILRFLRVEDGRDSISFSSQIIYVYFQHINLPLAVEELLG